MKQRYIKINRDLIPVTEEIYQIDNRWKEKERHRTHQDGECGQSDYRCCTGDCGICAWRTGGHRNISLNQLMEDYDSKTAELIDNRPLVEDIVSDRLLLERLYRQPDQLIPDGARMFRMRASHFTEREITQVLGIKAQSTLNYRIRKMDGYVFCFFLNVIRRFRRNTMSRHGLIAIAEEKQRRSNIESDENGVKRKKTRYVSKIRIGAKGEPYRLLGSQNNLL